MKGHRLITLAGRPTWVRRDRAPRVVRARALYLQCAQVTAPHFAVPTVNVTRRGRRGLGSSPAPEAYARRYALYLVRTLFEVTTPDLAAAAGVSKGYISRIVPMIEDLRDRPEIDGLVEYFERQIQTVAA